MKTNLDKLWNEIYCAVCNWNDDTEDDCGERILDQALASEYARSLYEKLIADLYEEGLI